MNNMPEEIEKICPKCAHFYEGDGWTDAKECAECTHSAGHYDNFTLRTPEKIEEDEF